MKSDSITRISLWSGPRNVSTALMYSFAQRSDTVVYDEPLYGYYLSNSNANEYHPGADEVLAAMEHDGTKVVEMMLGPHPKPVAFFKNMTHHLLDLDRSFMTGLHNIILTRDPVEVLPSFAREIPNPTMRDVGYQDHVELLNYLVNVGAPPLVLDSRYLLTDPAGILHQLCERLDIPMDKNMLAWVPGPRPEDGIWAKYWYGNVHQSTGFGRHVPKEGPFPDQLKPLLAKCLPLYEQLKACSLK